MVEKRRLAFHEERVVFRSQFSVTQNPKRWSNEIEIIKLIDEIVNLHLVANQLHRKLSWFETYLKAYDKCPYIIKS